MFRKSALRLFDGRPALAVAIALVTIGSGLSAPVSVAQSRCHPQDPSRLLVVDCLLPGQVRKLGGQMTY